MHELHEGALHLGVTTLLPGWMDVDLVVVVECKVDTVERDMEWVAVCHLTRYITDRRIEII